MRIRIPIHPAFLQGGGNFAQNKDKNERSLSEVLTKSEFKSMRSIIEILQTEKKTLRSEQNFLGRKQLIEHECKRSAKLVRGRSVRLVRTSL